MLGSSEGREEIVVHAADRLRKVGHSPLKWSSKCPKEGIRSIIYNIVVLKISVSRQAVMS